MSRDVGQWLDQLGLGKYSATFAENDVDFEVLVELQEGELRELGLSLGHRKKLLKAIAAIDDAPAAVTPDATTSATAPGEAERRQLTVMFCDLVGSTALSQRLDPEDLRELMRRYQDAVAGAVTRYGGHIAKYLGDGVLAYFGWPQAYEDQAERAVRAGLDAVAAVREVATDGADRLASRVGIASGEVVVGDLVSDLAKDTDAVSGNTPNLAARLQQAAEPDQVIIGAMTRHLVGQTFEVHALPRQSLKGFDEPIPAWLVSGESGAGNRFEAAQGQTLLPFVGRRGELNMLLDRWQTALTGEGQVVMISGEAGIGKSRLVQAFNDEIAATDFLRLRYQCAPYHTNSAYHPVVRQLEYAARLASGDSDEERLNKVRKLLAHGGNTDPQSVALIASLLSIPAEGDHQPGAMSPQQLKQQTETAILAQFVSLACRQPLLVIFEDAHWVDPSTREMLELMVPQIAGLPVLYIITHRPEFAASWLEQAHVTQLPVRRLSQPQVEEMIQLKVREIIRQAGGAELPGDKMDHIAAHADGVPLYIEELTHTILGSDAKLAGAEVPASLQASLTARLDQLGTAKRTAEVAAVIGREVPHDLLVAISKKSETELQKDLGELAQSGVMQRKNRGSETVYLFKHALTQDAAYQMLLRARRQEIHRDVARSLETHFPNRAAAEPELLAHHFEAGGETERAAQLWLQASRHSLARSATAEAFAQAKRGVAGLENIASSHERNSLEIDLQTCLALAAMAHHGYGADETERAFRRAHELLGGLVDDPRHIDVLHGFCALLGTRARFDDFMDIAVELLERAERSGDSASICAGHRCMAVGHNSRGEFIKAREVATRAVEFFDPVKHGASAQRFGHDVGVAAKMHLAIASRFLGFTDQATQLTEEALTLAHELEHPNTLGFAYMWASFQNLVSRDLDVALGSAATLEEVSRESANPNWSEHGRHMSSAALAAQAETATKGVDLISATIFSANSNYFRPMYLCFQAEGLCHLGRFDEATASIDEALQRVDDSAERWWLAELHRTSGHILCARGADAEAEVSFSQALSVARAQSARLLELRAANSMARLWQAQERLSEARDLLTPVHDWFSEGFEMPDLQRARALLEQPGPQSNPDAATASTPEGENHEHSQTVS